jgi:hypothetical protein
MWGPKTKQYFIDTLLRGLPTASIFLRQTIDLQTKKTMREVVDGQQRLSAILEFMENKFVVAKQYNEEFADKNFDELDDDTKSRFLNYKLATQMLLFSDESLIYDMFQRLNSNNTQLNAQELRNAQYWGEFKTFVVSNTENYRDFYQNIELFTNNNYSRMLDYEYTASLLISVLQGIITDSKSSIDNIYKTYDSIFDNKQIIQSKFDTVMSILENLFSDDFIKESIFRNKTYFYTLFNLIKFDFFGDDTIPRLNRDIEISDRGIYLSNIRTSLNNIIMLQQQLKSKELDDENMKTQLLEFQDLFSRRSPAGQDRKKRIIKLAELLA